MLPGSHFQFLLGGGDFGLDVTGIDTTNDAVQIKPVYPMRMKFDGFEMSEFSCFFFF